MILTKVSLTSNNVHQAPVKKPDKQQVSFGADSVSTENPSPSTLRKGVVLTLATIVLGLPIILCKLPVGRIKSLKALQDRFKLLMKTTLNPKPVLDKLMGRAQTSNTGLNLIR